MFHDAGRTYDSKHGDNLVDEFQKLFLKHKVEFALSLMLNHRHFDLHLDERLIEYRGTSVPWLTNHDKAQPSVWFVSEDNSCHPYEFHYSPDAATDGAATMPGDPEYKEFIKAFAQLLLEKNVEGLFGLCRYPGDDLEGRVEITEGRANINLHPDEVGLPDRSPVNSLNPPSSP